MKVIVIDRNQFLTHNNFVINLIFCSLFFEGQAKVRESLSYTAYKNMLKNILRYKESVEPQDLQQFVILKDSLELGTSVIDYHALVLPICFIESSMPSLPLPPLILLHCFVFPMLTFLTTFLPKPFSLGPHLVSIIIHYPSSPHIIQTFNHT